MQTGNESTVHTKLSPCTPAAVLFEGQTGHRPTDVGFLWGTAPSCAAVEAAQPGCTPAQHDEHPQPPQLRSEPRCRARIAPKEAAPQPSAAQRSHTSRPGPSREGKQRPAPPGRVTNSQPPPAPHLRESLPLAVRRAGGGAAQQRPAGQRRAAMRCPALGGRRLCAGHPGKAQP